MGFEKIKNTTAKKPVISQGPITTMYSEVLQAEVKGKYTKEPILRPSGFPICSILTMLRIQQFAKYGYTDSDESLFSEFFTSVGTTVHETVQKWTGAHAKLLADWQCVNPKCKNGKCKNKTCNTESCSDPEHYEKTLKVGDKCKHCGEAMVYHELEVEYGLITGHVDLIYKLPEGGFWAGDYKTVGLEKIAKLAEPSLNYIFQISSYAYILKHEYGVDIKGYSIFYITRDNPSIFKEFPFNFDAKEEEKAKQRILGETKKYKAAQKAIKTKDLSPVIATKPCSSLAKYEKYMGPFCNCPLAVVCFKGEGTLIRGIKAKQKELNVEVF